MKPPSSVIESSFVQDCDPLAGSLYCLRVPVPRQVLPRGNRGQPLPLSPLVLAHTAAPNTFDIRCQNQGCANFNNVSSANMNTDMKLTDYSLSLTLTFSLIH